MDLLNTLKTVERFVLSVVSSLNVDNTLSKWIRNDYLT